VSNANLQEVSDYVLSNEGAVVQTRLWVHDTFGHNWARRLTVYYFQDESVEILSGVEPKIESVLREIQSSWFYCTSEAGPCGVNIDVTAVMTAVYVRHHDGTFESSCNKHVIWKFCPR